MSSQPALTSLLSRPQPLTGAALLLLSALAWLQLFRSGPAAGVAGHHSHAGHFLAEPGLPTWGPLFAGTVFAMWVLMAIAMMLPTAAPAILTFADIARAGEHAGSPGNRVAAFIVGYLAAWGAFGALATAAQWALATLVLHSAEFGSKRPLLVGVALIGTGSYQFSAIKRACLTQCRSPIAFFLSHWRDGLAGAIYLGLRHGIHCVGCCWALMSLMLLGGTMSVGWTAGLTAIMLIEKIPPAGRFVVRAVGIALIAAGAAFIASTLTGRIPT